LVIELTWTRERMLAEIGATAGATQLPGLAEPSSIGAFADIEEVLLRTRLHHPREILGALGSAFLARFRAVPPERLERDLLAPIKKALGNAYKRGNRMDLDKWITLEVAVTRKGAFVEVTDEGAGFDVEATCARLALGSVYFLHHGSGFRKFRKTRAIISFADGGRTFRACFLLAADGRGDEPKALGSRGEGYA